MRYACCIISQEEPEQSLFFMLNALLQALVDIGDDIADNEDFNVGLASLLHSLVGVLDGRTERVDCRT